MLKKILSLLLSIYIMMGLFVCCFATNTSEESFVTFKANMSDPKIAAYYEYVYITVVSTDEGENNQLYTFNLYDYNDFTAKVTLPNGNYTIYAGGIENDIEQGPLTNWSDFTVGSSPHIIVEFTVNKDMSEYPDRTTTTVVSNETTTFEQQITSSTPSSTTKTPTIIETTTSDKTVPITEPDGSPANLFPIIISIVLGIGIIIVIVFLIKKYR